MDYEMWYNNSEYGEMWISNQEYVEAWTLVNGKKTLVWEKSLPYWRYLAFDYAGRYAVLIDERKERVKYIGKYYENTRNFVSSYARVFSYSVGQDYIIVHDQERSNNYYVYDLKGNCIGTTKYSEPPMPCHGTGPDGYIYSYPVINNDSKRIYYFDKSNYVFRSFERVKPEEIIGRTFGDHEGKMWTVNGFGKFFNTIGSQGLPQENYTKHMCWIPVYVSAINDDDKKNPIIKGAYCMINLCDHSFRFFDFITTESTQIVDNAANFVVFTDNTAILGVGEKVYEYNLNDGRLSEYPINYNRFRFIDRYHGIKFSDGKCYLGSYGGGRFSTVSEIPETIQQTLNGQAIQLNYGEALRLMYDSTYSPYTSRYNKIIDLKNGNGVTDFWGYDYGLYQYGNDMFVIFDNYNGKFNNNCRIITEIDYNPASYRE